VYSWMSAITLSSLHIIHHYSDSVCNTNNKPALVNSNFVPVAPPGELDETYVSSLILAHSLHYVKT